MTRLSRRSRQLLAICDAIDPNRFRSQQQFGERKRDHAGSSARRDDGAWPLLQQYANELNDDDNDVPTVPSCHISYRVEAMIWNVIGVGRLHARKNNIQPVKRRMQTLQLHPMTAAGRNGEQLFVWHFVRQQMIITIVGILYTYGSTIVKAKYCGRIPSKPNYNVTTPIILIVNLGRELF